VRFGVYLPNFGPFGDAQRVADLAREAEQAGWDGFFLWDHVARSGPRPVVDPWIALTAVAMATRRIRLGTTVTPLPRRRPWKLARETVSLDRLSGGRLILGVGLGSGHPLEWDGLGEETQLKRRGAMLDEGLRVLTGRWSGEPFAFEGEHYRVGQSHFQPPPQQSPRIPIWVAAMWPHRAPLRRAARWDGVFPLFFEEPGDPVQQLGEAVRYVREQRVGEAPFDVVYVSQSASEDLGRIARAGATWWLLPLVPDAFGADWQGEWPFEAMRARVRAGPPSADEQEAQGGPVGDDREADEQDEEER
jgi:alkanesulfonate monooxygenase SsuD/methylene tetrahydromethanopterin reductase-like flavin-dependent oxidoreductase (luciferase family)